jgi:hypothetical protein
MLIITLLLVAVLALLSVSISAWIVALGTKRHPRP